MSCFLLDLISTSGPSVVWSAVVPVCWHRQSNKGCVCMYVHSKLEVTFKTKLPSLTCSNCSRENSRENFITNVIKFLGYVHTLMICPKQSSQQRLGH